MEAKLKIMKAAKILFEKNGYSKTKTKEIADSANVNEVTIFRIFGKKRNLFREVFKHYYYLPKVEELESLLLLESKEFLTSLAESVYSVLIMNKMILLHEIRNEFTFADNFFKDFVSELLDKMEMYFSNKSDIEKETIDIRCNNFLASIFGLFVNSQILGLMEDSADLSRNFEMLVENF